MRNPYLPEEILIQIFSKLPPNSVGRCRCLSKLWRRNLSTSQFVNLHLKVYKTDQKDAILSSHHRCVHTIRIPVDGGDEVVSRKLDFPATFDYVVDSCNGLVLLVNEENEMFVVNPLTLQQASIKNTSLSVDKDEKYMTYSYGFGYDSCCDDYKIVKLTHSSRTVTSVDVYSMQNDVWKSVDSSPFNHDIYCEDNNGVFVNGAIHWSALDEDEQYVIVAFDVATESFRRISVPNGKLKQFLAYSVYAIGGCLLMLNTVYRLDMWIMKEYGLVNSWTNFSIASPCHRVKPLGFIGENEVVFLTDRGTLLMWNLTEGTTKEIGDNGAALGESNGGIMFLASLVSPIQYGVAS